MPIKYKSGSKRRGGYECVFASAYDGRRLVGKVDACESLHYMDVARAHVLEPYRRRGIGTRLYDLAAREACAHGKPLRSKAWQRSRPAGAFWEKQLRHNRAIRDGDVVTLPCPAPQLAAFGSRMASTMSYVQAGHSGLVAMSRGLSPAQCGDRLAERAIRNDVRFDDFGEFLRWFHHADVMNLGPGGEQFTRSARADYARRAWLIARRRAPLHFSAARVSATRKR